MKRKNLIIFLEYLFVFFVILDFNTTYRYFEWFVKYTNVLSLATITLLLIMKGKNVKINHIIVFYLLGSIIPLSNMSPKAIGQYVRSFFLLIPMITMCFQACRKEGRYFSLLICFHNIILVEAIISLFFWGTGSIMEIIKPTSYIPYIWNNDSGYQLIPSYYGIYFETQQFEILGIARNSGIFMEGPMHNMVLCVALGIECFIRNKKAIWRICVLAVAIVSTITSTGAIFLLIIFMMYLYNRISKRYRLFSLFAFALMLFTFFLWTSTIIDIKKDSGGDSSIDARRADIERCIEVGMDNPILGVGIYHTRGKYITNSQNYGFSNSIFTTFAHGGLYFMILYLVLLFIIPLRRYISRKDMEWAIILMLFFFVFTITISHYRMLTFMFLALSLSNIRLNKTV